MTPGTSQAGRRVLLNRLYAEYAADPALAVVRAEAQGVLVPGDGPVSPRLMFVGEAPGRLEAKQRKPFVGASGRILAELLESVGLYRDSVYITNLVKYRPLDNRDPTAEERWAGIPYLRRENALLGHPPIVMLGRHATKAVQEGYELPDGMTIGEWWTMRDGVHVLPLFHPAYAIYQRSNRELMFEQFKAVTRPPRRRRAAQ